MLDLGTGDGGFVLHTARQRPDALVIGIDANADNLRVASHRAAAKPARGGLANALFGRLSLAEAPGELVGLADELTVLFPWGGLLAAIARAEGEALGRVRALCKPAAAVRLVFGYGAADAGAVSALPALGDPGFGAAVARRYREAGLAVTARVMTAEGIRTLPTTWAKTLAFSGKARTFWELRGCVADR